MVEAIMVVTAMEVAMEAATVDMVSHTNKTTSKGTLIRSIKLNCADISCNQDRAPSVKPALLHMVNQSCAN